MIRRAEGWKAKSLIGVVPVVAMLGCGGQPVALSGHEVPLLAEAQRIGPAEPADPLVLSVSLQPRNLEERDSLLRDLYDPQSPLFHHFLTPEEYTDRFGATVEETEEVSAFLQAQGLQVNSVSPNRLLINASATIGQAQRAFGTSISQYLLADGRTAYANDSAPIVPASLAGIVKSVRGLDNTVLRHPHLALAAEPHAAPAGFGPADLSDAYDISVMQSAGLNGQGQTLAVFELDGYPPTDPPAYFTHFNITPAPVLTNILVDGATGNPGAGAIEVDLDIEVLGGIAPAAAQLIYEGPNSDTGTNDTYNKIVTDNKATVMSTSWGQCEANSGSAELKALDDIFMQGAAQGISFFAAAGDSGAYDCQGSTTLAIDSPGSDPYVSSVGGTTLTLNAGTYGSESVWGNSAQKAGGGGGLSLQWPLPSWQTGGPGIRNSYSNGMRQVPDVSANADPATGDLIYCTATAANCPAGGFLNVGGTSAAAPTWAASMTLINQYLLSQHKTVVGFANPAFYALFNTYQNDTSTVLFHDVTSGTNLFYPATAGYDQASGIGSPDVDKLAKALVIGTNSTVATPTPTPGGTATPKPTNAPGGSGSTSVVRGPGWGILGCDVGGMAGAPAGAGVLCGLFSVLLIVRRRRSA